MTDKETRQVLVLADMIDEVTKHFEKNNWLNVKEFQAMIVRTNKKHKKSGKIH